MESEEKINRTEEKTDSSRS